MHLFVILFQCSSTPFIIEFYISSSPPYCPSLLLPSPRRECASPPGLLLHSDKADSLWCLLSPLISCSKDALCLFYASCQFFPLFHPFFSSLLLLGNAQRLISVLCAVDQNCQNNLMVFWPASWPPLFIKFYPLHTLLFFCERYRFVAPYLWQCSALLAYCRWQRVCPAQATLGWTRVMLPGSSDPANKQHILYWRRGEWLYGQGELTLYVFVCILLCFCTCLC